MITAYTDEKLTNAVRYLATSAEPLSRRLEHAYIEACTLSEDNFSPERRDRWSKVIESVTTEETVGDVGDEGSIHATLSKMSTDEQIEAAVSIFSLFLDVTREYWRQGRRK